MIERKKKLCKCGCGRMGYIWAKGMLKECYRRTHPYAKIKKWSVKGKKRYEEKKLETQKQWEFFLEIWNERIHCSDVSGEYLGEEPFSYFFDHALEKSKFPELRWEKRNIILCTMDEHYAKTNGHPLPKHEELIEKIKKELL